MIQHTRRVAAFMLILTVFMAACATSTNGSTVAKNGTGSSTTAKSKPTAVPTITMAFCQSILTIAEANQIMQPATPATALRIDSSKLSGSCNYEYASFQSVVSVAFLPFAGGSLSSFISLQEKSASGVTTQSISNVGDQAEFTTGTIPSASIKEDFLYVVDGDVLFDIFDPNAGSLADAKALADFKQIASLVISRF